MLCELSTYSRACGYWEWGMGSVLGSPGLGEPHSHSHPNIPVQTWTSLCPILVLCALSVRWWGQVTLRVPPVKQAAGMARAEDKREQGAG